MESNKIYLGDAYELIKQIDDKSVDLVIIDPPYLMDEHGGGGAFGNKNLGGKKNDRYTNTI